MPLSLRGENRLFLFYLRKNAPANIFPDDVSDTGQGSTATRVIFPGFKIKPIIEGQFLSLFNSSVGEKKDSILTKSRGAVCNTGMINVTGDASALSTVDVPFTVQFKLVNIGLFPLGLPFLSQELPPIGFSMGDLFPGIFDDLGSRRDRDAGINSSPMNFRVSNF